MAERTGLPGGSFAPPVSDKQLKTEWPKLLEEVGERSITGQALKQLHTMITKHKAHTPNTKGGKLHATGRAMVVPLSTKAKESCEDCIPNADELKVMSQLFEGLSGPVRTMAFHMLWYATELSLGREPITSDQVIPLV